MNILSVDRYLWICREAEEAMAIIYRHWAVAENCPDQLRELWHDMADEESEHAQRVEMLRRICRRSEIGTQTMPDNSIQSLFSLVENYRDEITSTVFEARESFALALGFEDDFKAFHSAEAFEISEKGLKQLFLQLAHNDEEHVERLKRIYAETYHEELEPRRHELPPVR